MSDVGIDDNLIKPYEKEVEPGTSSLFLVTSDAVVDRVKEQPAGPTHSSFTPTCPNDQEAALRRAFADE